MAVTIAISKLCGKEPWSIAEPVAVHVAGLGDLLEVAAYGLLGGDSEELDGGVVPVQDQILFVG